MAEDPDLPPAGAPEPASAPVKAGNADRWRPRPPAADLNPPEIRLAAVFANDYEKWGLGPFGEEPFWDDMRKELNELLTGKEHRKAIEDARDWVKIHRDLRR